MKKIILLLIVILIVALVVFGGTKMFNKKDKKESEKKSNTVENVENKVSVDEDFYKSEEYLKIVNNREKIVRVREFAFPEGGQEISELDIDKTYNEVKNLKIIEETNERIIDADSYYLFEFEDGDEARIYFEGSYLNFNNKNYKIEK